MIMRVIEKKTISSDDFLKVLGMYSLAAAYICPRHSFFHKKN